MLIRDLFRKKIDRDIEGVVTIGNESEQQKWMELEEYVCTEEITRCFRVFFRKYRESITTSTGKMGVWITGFFGSGKSHFLKILGYLLENEEVKERKPVQYFEEKLKDQIILADIKASAKVKNKVVLFNIDSKAKSDSKNKTQAIMDIMIRAFNESIGYCGSSPWVADLERSLEEEGNLDAFVAKFEELSTRNWAQTRSKALLNRDYIVRSLVSVRNMTEESAKQYIDDQMKNYTNTTEEFAQIVNNYCQKNRTRVVFLMDEVGQFIGDNTQLMLNLQTCVEDLGKFCHGQAWVVVTSQQELKAMIDSTRDKQQDFSKIQGRFDTRILLSGANADEVIKERILAKKDTAYTPLEALYEANQSKLSSKIIFPAKPTWSGYSDASEFRAVYPFVSYQFELLQKVFESIREHGMSEGKHLSQNERSLLSAFQNSAKNYADSESGVLVPFDSFYSTIEEFIDYDVKTVFANAERRAGLDPFALRVLRILFMIKHVKEMPATIDRLATMMLESIDEDKAVLKEKILAALNRLEEETLIQKNGDEYDFLTNAEQDVNRQINNTSYNDSEVQRVVFDIVFDKIMDNNKYRYEGRYDFILNRYIDSDIRGSFSLDGLTMRICTVFSGMRSEMDFASESARSSSVVIDLTEGTYIDELIHANKIETFKRNNSASMSATLTEIMSKKTAEISDRKKRAEDIIREVLRSAPIYLAGNKLDIKQKDGKDRINEALKAMVKQEYYKLPLVSYFYQDQRSILSKLNETGTAFDNDISQDANYAAYEEIFDKIKDDKSLMKVSTVKTLVDYFTKKPYGWRDLDIIGMIGDLWKGNCIQITVHDNLVEQNDNKFKNNLVHKAGIDAMVVSQSEKIDEEILYSVKRIMKEIYSENLPLDENQLKSGVVSFFERKQSFLQQLRLTFGSDYAGCTVATEIYNLFCEILRSRDSASIFNAVISNKENLDKYAEVLEQLETFYKDGSSQQKNYQDAQAISEWYRANALLADLSKMEDVIGQIDEILSLEMPFTRMNGLASLVFQANEIKDAMLEDKLQRTVKRLESDRDTISKEQAEALAKDLKQEQYDEIQDKADKLLEQYEAWLKSLDKNTPNMDQYITSSESTVRSYRDFIAQTMNNSSDKPARSKRVKIINCIPVANKKVKSKEDIEKVVDSIRQTLLKELDGMDEVDLD